tara:strand:+ start:3816 stop:6374 length:2559 start_codon:yes stop_codon:yes gene_type:complete
MSHNYDNYPPKEKKDSYKPIIPPEADQVPSGMIKDLQRTGSENYIYQYKDINNRTCFYIKRTDPARGKKSFTPMSFDPDKNTWVPKAWPDDRPLFKEHLLNGSDKPVIIVEGEKAANAAAKIFKDSFDIVCWSGGSNQVHLTNYAALKDKDITLWPDNDAAGIEAMTEAALILLDQGVTDKIDIIKLSKLFPDKWDLADNFPADAANEGINIWGLIETKGEFVADDKLEKKIRKKWEEQDNKLLIFDIADQYVYVRQTDEWFEIKTHEFVTMTKLNHDWAHKFRDKSGRGDLSVRLLANPDTKKVLNYIKLAQRESGVIYVTKKDHPLINEGKYLNIYNQHSIDLVQGDIKVFSDFYINLLGIVQYTILIKWMAFIVQNRGVKVPWCPVIVTPEGAGKGILAEKILAKILGDKNVATNASYQNVISKHATIIRDNILVVLNELVIMGQHSEKKEVSNALKSLITDAFVIIDEKNKSIVNILNTTNFLIFSNKKACLHLDNSSRRYAVMYVDWNEKDFEQWEEEGRFATLVNWLEDGGASNLAYYFQHEVVLTEEDLRSFKGRAPKTDALEEMKKNSRHPMIKKLDTKLDEAAAPFTDDWVGYISKNQLITWMEANFKGHAPDDDVEDWLKQKCTPWKNGDLTRRMKCTDGFRPHIYLIKDRPAEGGEGSYKDWTEGELGAAPDTGTLSISNELHPLTKGPLKFAKDRYSDNAIKAMHLAKEIAHSDLEVIEMAYNFKKAQSKAIGTIEKAAKKEPWKFDGTVEVNESGEEFGKTIFKSIKQNAKDRITEEFIKDFALIFKQSDTPEWHGDKDVSYQQRKAPVVKLETEYDKTINRVKTQIKFSGSKKWEIDL